jgi:hypothetical protein
MKDKGFSLARFARAHNRGKKWKNGIPKNWNIDGLVKILKKRPPGESRGPENLEITGFRLSPE